MAFTGIMYCFEYQLESYLGKIENKMFITMTDMLCGLDRSWVLCAVCVTCVSRAVYFSTVVKFVSITAQFPIFVKFYVSFVGVLDLSYSFIFNANIPRASVKMIGERLLQATYNKWNPYNTCRQICSNIFFLSWRSRRIHGFKDILLTR